MWVKREKTNKQHQQHWSRAPHKVLYRLNEQAEKYKLKYVLWHRKNVLCRFYLCLAKALLPWLTPYKLNDRNGSGTQTTPKMIYNWNHWSLSAIPDQTGKKNSQQTKPDVFKWNVQGNWAIMFISARSWVDSKTTHFSIVLNDRLIRYNFNELLWRPIASNFQFFRKNERKESCSSLIYNRSILNEIWQAAEKRTLASCSS